MAGTQRTAPLARADPEGDVAEGCVKASIHTAAFRAFSHHILSDFLSAYVCAALGAY